MKLSEMKKKDQTREQVQALIWEATQNRVVNSVWAGTTKSIWRELDMKFHGVLFDDSITSKCWNRLVVHDKTQLRQFLRPENTL